MAGVGVEVGLEGLLGALLQIVVLSDELLELRLDIDNLLPRELEFDNGDASGLEVRQETDFIGLFGYVSGQGASNTTMMMEIELT